MNPLFEPQVYQNRRAKLTAAVKSGIAVFLGNHEAPMNYPDNTYNFRQDSDFLYFFGLSIADIAAVISAIGNILPAPFIIAFIRVIMDWLKGVSETTRRFVAWLEKKGTGPKASGSRNNSEFLMRNS